MCIDRGKGIDSRAQDRADMFSGDRGRKDRDGPGAERVDGPGGAAGEHA